MYLCPCNGMRLFGGGVVGGGCGGDSNGCRSGGSVGRAGGGGSSINIPLAARSAHAWRLFG